MSLIINGIKIDEGAIEQEFASIKSYHEGLANVCCCHRNEEFRDEAQQQVISWVLLNQEAKRRLPSVPSERLEAAVTKWKHEQFGDIPPADPDGPMPAYEVALREQVEQQVRVETLVESVCEDLPAVTDDDLRRFYDDNLALFMTEEQVQVSHLIKSPQRSEDREQSFRELRDLRERILGGEDFDELAREHTDREDKAIDLGFFAKDELPAEFALPAFSMHEGEVSPVIVTQYGLHLLRIVGRRAPQARPFEDVREEVRALLETERRQALVGKLVEQLRAKADIRQAEPDERRSGALASTPTGSR